MTEALHGAALEAALAKHPDWRLAAHRPAIEKSFAFKDFNQAFGFMTRVAMMAEKLDHHPEWSNVYNRVEVALSTHDSGGVTEKDIALAAAMDAFAAALRQG